MKHELTIQNGNHTAERCPVCVTLPDLAADPAGLELTDTATGRLVPHQVCTCAATGPHRLAYVADSLAPGETRALSLTDDVTHPWTDRVTMADVDGDHVDVCIDGQLFTAYCYGPERVRPFCHPVVGPYGESVTRGYPMVEGIEHELDDHPHHKGFYVAHGEVGTSDNWSEVPGHGYVVTRDLSVTPGPVYGQINAHNDWVDKDRNKQCEERRRYRIWALPAAGRLIDLTVTFVASEGDLVLGDTKEGGLCSLRLHYHCGVGSIITSPTGAVTADGTPDETWGKRYHWLDHSGPVGGRWVGAAIMDTPGNFRYPTYWHVRTNGMMCANPFALSYYFGDKSASGAHTVPAGAEMTFRYRVYFHAGDVTTGRVAEKYNNYVFGPTLVEPG